MLHQNAILHPDNIRGNPGTRPAIARKAAVQEHKVALSNHHRVFRLPASYLVARSALRKLRHVKEQRLPNMPVDIREGPGIHEGKLLLGVDVRFTAVGCCGVD